MTAKSGPAGKRRRALLLTLALAGANPLLGQEMPQKSALAQLSGAVRELTDRVSPAVVEVVVNGFGATDDGGRVSNQISRRQSSGSGVVVNSSGYIITNAHVIQGAINLKVLPQSPRPPGAEPRQILRPLPVDARVLGIDRESDLALLKIDAKNLPVLPFGDSDKLRQGDLVLAIGSPLGLRNSVSMGVVSAAGRAISDDNPILYIQTDASINPGNSGGALVDHDGFLVGVNSFIVTQSGGNEGIGFAIPSNVVRNVYRQLKQKGRVSRGSVWAFIQNITLVLAKGLGLPVQRGVVVADLEPGGPAERAGLKRKDIILSLNGNEVDTARRFDADINRRQGGEKLDLLVQRADDRLTIGVEVEEQSAPWEAGIPWTVLAQGMFALPVNISGTQDRSFGWTRTWFDCDRELIENGIPRVFTPALTLHGDDVVGGIPPLADRIGLPEELRLSRRCQSSFLTSAMWIFRECLPPGSAPVPPLRGTSVRGASSSLAHPSEHGEGAVGTVLQARRR